jgi:hypothetical protein
MKKNVESLGISLFVEMKTSKLINYSTYMCWSCQVLMHFYDTFNFVLQPLIVINEYKQGLRHNRNKFQENIVRITECRCKKCFIKLFASFQKKWIHLRKIKLIAQFLRGVEHEKMRFNYCGNYCAILSNFHKFFVICCIISWNNAILM